MSESESEDVEKFYESRRVYGRIQYALKILEEVRGSLEEHAPSALVALDSLLLAVDEGFESSSDAAEEVNLSTKAKESLRKKLKKEGARWVSFTGPNSATQYVYLCVEWPAKKKIRTEDLIEIARCFYPHARTNSSWQGRHHYYKRERTSGFRMRLV